MYNELKFKDKSPSFYKEYPRLFGEYYKHIQDETIDNLSKAGYYYYHAVLSLDTIIDDANFKEIAQMLALQEESIKILASIYCLKSPFWDCWNKRKEEYFKAVKIEKSISYTKEIDFETYGDLADKKSAFGKVAIDSLYVLDTNPVKETYNKLLLSHKYFSVGFQLYDDVKDFKEDFEKGQFNFAIHELKRKIDADYFKNDVSTLNKLLFIKGVGQEILAKSIEQFEKAISILSTLKIQSKWLKTVMEMKHTIENYLYITNGYIATIKAKLEIKNQQKDSYSFFKYDLVKDYESKKALDFIKSDYSQNYVDLKHIMYLGKLEGFENELQTHASDTFQRAAINDCFINVANANNLNISDFLKNECHYLANRRNKDEIGGWSYFPTVCEIAADIDDLGQILQLFVLSENRQFVDEYCQEAILIVLNERMLSNGGIETWIIPKNNQTSIQKKQEHFNGTKWGKGPDVEVVANFIYSLLIFDKIQYKSVIEKSISYVLQQQNDKGYWESRWYYGTFYGTYVCLRLLKEFRKDYSTTIQKAIDYLIDSQNNDGGYSINKNEVSDPLSSSFSILSLKLFLEKDNEIIGKAIKYLRSTQNQDGSWTAVDFIKPKAHEPYKSKTLTTAYVLKAFCQ